MCRVQPSAFQSAVLIALGVLSLSASSAAGVLAAEPKAAPAPDEKTIRATAEAFTDAFNRGSAKDVAALWTADGSLVDEQGKLLKGRAAIEAEYAAFFKENPGAKIDVSIKSVEFPTPSVAVEDGVARVSIEKAGAPAASRYTAVHALTAGKWLMASVREAPVEVPSNITRLDDLQWLVGKWQMKSDDTTFESNFHWIANKSFLARDYTTRRAGLVTSTGTQIIGWDPQAGQLRSWSFDSAGGFGTGEWARTAEGWRIESSGVMADGSETFSVDFLIRVPDDANVFGWRSADRRVGEISLPRTPEVVFDRVPEKNPVPEKK